MISLHLQVLEADNNAIENLEGVYHLPRLEEVLLKNNSILKSELHISNTYLSGIITFVICLFVVPVT